MNIRNFYWLMIVVLSGALLFEWTSGKKADAIESHLMIAESMSQVGLGENYVAVENEELFLVVSVETGSVIIVEEASFVVVTTCAGGATLAVELEPLTLRTFPT